MTKQDRERVRRIAALRAVLLRSPGLVTREQIAKSVEGYEGKSDEAQRKLLRRDLHELGRTLGLQVEHVDADSSGQTGYRVRAGSLKARTLRLDVAEKAALGLALQIGGGSVARPVLEAAVGLPELESTGWVLPSLEMTEREETILGAILARSPIRFSYAKPDGPIEDRRVHPFRLLWAGERYLIAFDLDRGDQRTFKVERIVGDPAVDDATDAYEIPNEIDDRVLPPWLSEPTQVATLRVSSDRDWEFRRVVRCDPTEVGEQWATFNVAYSAETEFTAFLAGFGADLVADAPQSLRDSLIKHLQGIAGP